MRIIDTSYYKKAVKKLNKTKKSVEQWVAEEKKQLENKPLPGYLPAGFKDAVIKNPEFAVATYAAFSELQLSKSEWTAAKEVTNDQWNAAIKQMLADETLVGQLKLAAQGDTQATKAARSRAVKIGETIDVIGTALVAFGVILITVGLVLVGFVVTFEVGVVLIVVGLILAFAGGVADIVGTLIIVWAS